MKVYHQNRVGIALQSSLASDFASKVAHLADKHKRLVYTQWQPEKTWMTIVFG